MDRPALLELGLSQLVDLRALLDLRLAQGAECPRMTSLRIYHFGGVFVRVRREVEWVGRGPVDCVDLLVVPVEPLADLVCSLMGPFL